MDPLLLRFQALLGGQYVIERELGRGGMATVFLAKDLRHGRSVAIKLLQPELTTATTAERFLREIQITAKLQHPHILTLLDSGASDGLVYYVMPLVEGESLRDRLLWEKQLSIEQAIHIARQVASGLAYAHTQGVIHRDIKPENILLSTGQAIVADFGIARAMFDSSQASITAAGLPLGTPAYMSPEQASGSDRIDHRSDIYALGCLLFEMLAGRPPFVAPTIGQVLSQHVRAPAPKVSSFRTAVPAEVEHVVERMLAKDPKDRYQSATDLGDALGLLEAVETLERRTPNAGWRRLTPESVEVSRAHPQTALGVKRLLILGGTIGGVVLAGLGLAGKLAPLPIAPAPGSRVEAGAASAGFISAIGVKPLDASGADSMADMIAAGIAEEVTAHLTRVKGLKVVSRTSMEYAARQRWPSRTIADSLGIRYLVEGSVQRAGPDAVVTLRLIDAVNEGHLWGESFRMPVRNALMAREEVVQKALVALAGRVQGVDAAEHDSSTANLEAIQAVARGRELMGRATPDNLNESIRAFERALTLDPKFAAAAAGLSVALRTYVDLGFLGRDLYKTLAQALQWGDRAVTLNPKLADAWLARATARLNARARPETVVLDMDRAVRLAPSSGEIRVFRGIALAELGRYDDASKDVTLGAELDPLSGLARGGGVAMTALGARQYPVAILEAKLAQSRDPFVEYWRVVEAVARYLNGDPQRCLDIKLTGIGVPVHALCLWKLGRGPEAQQLIDSVAATVGTNRDAGIYTTGLIAMYHAQLGHAAETLKWLERGFAVSPVAIDFRLLDCGLVDPIRNDPVFTKGMDAIWTKVRARFF